MGQKKMDKRINNDLQNTTQKTKDWETRIWLKGVCVCVCVGAGVWAPELRTIK